MARRQDRSSSRIQSVALRVSTGRRGSLRPLKGVGALAGTDLLRSRRMRAEMLKVGEKVQTAVDLPGIPSGSIGRIKKVEPLFLVVEFEDGHIGYYSPRQLLRPPPSPDSPTPPPDL